MEVLVAKSSGFCQGVKKAVDTAMIIDPFNTFLYGEIIHNEEVMKGVVERGIQVVDDIALVPNGATLIIRSHGVGKKIYKICEERNIKIVDCTCEFVKRSQRIVNEKFFEGKTNVINILKKVQVIFFYI